MASKMAYEEAIIPGHHTVAKVEHLKPTTPKPPASTGDSAPEIDDKYRLDAENNYHKELTIGNVSYDFSRALFGGAPQFFWRTATPGLVAYHLFLIVATIVAALCSCPQQNNAPSWSVITGYAGCWSNQYQMGWSDLTLMALCSFLLALLVNNVTARYWSLRLLVQDAINTNVSLFNNVNFWLKRHWTSEEEKDRTSKEEENNCIHITERIERRLSLAFHFMLVAARTGFKVDMEMPGGARTSSEGKVTTVFEDEIAFCSERPWVAWEEEIPRNTVVGQNPKAIVVGTVEGQLSKKVEGQLPKLIIKGEAEILRQQKHNAASTILSWVQRDIQQLYEKKHFQGDCKLSDFFSTLATLRKIANDLPMQVHVQLPFITVAMTACVVHLTIFQVCYVSASLIGAGISTPFIGAKALTGFFSIVFVPAIFLYILKLQSVLSNPFGVFLSDSNFNIKVLGLELEHKLAHVEAVFEGEARRDALEEQDGGNSTSSTTPEKREANSEGKAQ